MCFQEENRFTGPESLLGVYLCRNPTIPTGAMASIQLDIALGALFIVSQHCFSISL